MDFNLKVLSASPLRSGLPEAGRTVYAAHRDPPGAWEAITSHASWFAKRSDSTTRSGTRGPSGALLTTRRTLPRVAVEQLSTSPSCGRDVEMEP